jgi:PleD family two-component response regulator
MAAFCCKLLDERGGIVVSTDLAAETVDAAIRHAAEAFHKGNKSSSSRRVYSFEVWSGTSRLFPPQLNPAVPNGATNGVKLIVVDDDKDVRSVVAGFLVDAGYHVVGAEDGAQALALLTDDPSGLSYRSRSVAPDCAT